MYLWLKTLHITFALSSAALFVWRLAWNWSGRKASGIRRWGPHLVDTLLLLSALGLVHLAMPWPLPLWLLAKLGLLLGYIVCAAFALRMARGPGKGLLSVLSLTLLGGNLLPGAEQALVVISGRAGAPAPRPSASAGRSGNAAAGARCSPANA